MDSKDLAQIRLSILGMLMPGRDGERLNVDTARLIEQASKLEQYATGRDNPKGPLKLPGRPARKSV